MRALVRRLDAVEAGALAALAALGMAVLGGLLLKVWIGGGVVTGGDGFLVADPLQYLDWARQAGEHGLIGNRHDLAPGERPFLHPGLLLSGLAWRLGAGPAVAYLLWKPVAVGILFAGTIALVRRFLARRDDRRLGLVLALFACSPVAAIVGWGGLGGPGDKLQVDFITGELWSGSYLWGYLFTAIAVGTLAARAAGLRARAGRRRGAGDGTARLSRGSCAPGSSPGRGRPSRSRSRSRSSSSCAAAGRRRPPRATSRCRWPRPRRRSPTTRCSATSTPRGRSPRASTSCRAGRGGCCSRGWRRSRSPRRSRTGCRRPTSAPWRCGSGRSRRCGVYFQPFGTFPFHALQGLTPPLVVLAMLALRAHLGERPIGLVPALAAVALLVVLGSAYRVDGLADAVHIGRQPFTLEPGERDALRHLDELAEPGGVLAPVYTGIAVPAYTGRETWIGAGSWTPDQPERARDAEALFDGRLGEQGAEALVRRSRARFVLSDCHGRADISQLLAGFTDPPRRFGCASVWRVR